MISNTTQFISIHINSQFQSFPMLFLCSFLTGLLCQLKKAPVIFCQCLGSGAFGELGRLENGESVKGAAGKAWKFQRKSV